MSEYVYAYELVIDGDPRMDGSHERRTIGRFTSLEDARRGYEITAMRSPVTRAEDNMRIERRKVGPWEVVE